ncbi:pitrilysin family protein [Xenorhabdus nematophila]|uniref:Peptidase with LuxS/MPP-like metallohydrolase domain n=1 Tax=Xenorhabdus nematophila (strain ATCC 19061 / DSM 3370 / CCUG 14189 / LMG 1036 / NCIMB 9965 / AN6) TaxID=406817 RepID=D3VF50_XENNA|nr:pitrilysin family protein [Xenorhabdus nematophila]CEE90970.1 putative peptidase with LuxS/MPP-like metallohydrolase domain [Xenorhabdus nematophila str. Anatoliense]CBJ92507.1 putative peptidase with LuxS/MPP-like metallohydrolase domain [Xenorhabdus nematophila ATCC 19061]CCW31345.1 Protein yhjJ [Xenorhabdus nematophila F1]CEE91135.1 putative peptidase with LuxS/MPP-like metallohydrolase domain [Xenorhabdus nematophila str. Anatoliense]CEK25320.1 putative peptidase with LuxS/MPP-like meta
MQGNKIGYLIGGAILATTCLAQAETLQPDPAWQQGKLENGFSWQILQTPQRPNDRIQLRLLVKTGSLAEKNLQRGYTYLIPKVVLSSSKDLSSQKLENLWRNAMDTKNPFPPAIVSYDFTLYSLSLPNHRSNLLQDALIWLSDIAGGAVFTPETLAQALKEGDHPITTFPADIQDPVWRMRLQGSTLIDHDPGMPVSVPVDVKKVESFYHQWYTPDAMTLYVAGHVDNRLMSERINQTFSSLTGKRQTPVPVPTLLPLKAATIGVVNELAKQDRLSLTWNLNWLPINDSQTLIQYWLNDLTREALYRYLQSGLKEKQDGMQLGLDCRVLYQRANCSLNLDAPTDKLMESTLYLASQLSSLRENGLPQEQFDELYKQKRAQLQQLFAMYARTDTDILINQRLLSQQNNVIDIAPEQFRRLRQVFLSSLTPQLLNQKLKEMLSQEISFILVQPKGEAKVDVSQIKNSFNQIMRPGPVPEKPKKPETHN